MARAVRRRRRPPPARSEDRQTAARADRPHDVDNAVTREIREATADHIDRSIDRSLDEGRPMHPAEADPEMDGVDVTASEVQVRMSLYAHSRSQRKEYRLKLLHRMMLRQLPTDMIAKALGVDTRHVNRLKQELKAQLRKEASSKDLATYVGYTDGFYNEMIGMSMRIATNKDTPETRKLSAMKVALQSERDRTEFLKDVGFFSAMKLLPSVDEGDYHSQRANQLLDMSNKVLEAFDADAEYEYDGDGEDQGPEPHEVFKQPDRGEDDDGDIHILSL